MSAISANGGGGGSSAAGSDDPGSVSFYGSAPANGSGSFHNIPRGATAANSHANNGSASKQGDEEGEILEETSLDVGISTKVGESGENTVSL